MKIEDKVAIVTGGANGIGRAVGFQLVRKGVKKVALVDMSDSVSSVADEINQGTDADVAIAYQGDTTEEKFRKQVFSELNERYGLVQICIPAAGITRDSLAVRIDKETGEAIIYPQEKFKQVVEVNLIAPTYWAMEMIAGVAKYRYQNGLKKWHSDEGVQGTVVFVGSISSKGNKGQVSYAATKAGLKGVSSTLTKEAIFHGIRCGVIHPGFTDTPMVQVLGDDYLSKHVLPNTQLGRLIRPEEIADAICFMIANSSVSGDLWADAGWHSSPT